MYLKLLCTVYLKLLCTVYPKLPILFTFDGLSLTVWQIDKWWIHFSFSHSVFFWRKLLLPLICLFFCSLHTDSFVWRNCCCRWSPCCFVHYIQIDLFGEIVAAVDLLVVLFIIQNDLAWLLQVKLLLEELQFDRRFVEISWFTTSSSTRIQNVAAFSTETYSLTTVFIFISHGASFKFFFRTPFLFPFVRLFYLSARIPCFSILEPSVIFTLVSEI